jgi:hypothetical protein
MKGAGMSHHARVVLRAGAILVALPLATLPARSAEPLTVASTDGEMVDSIARVRRVMRERVEVEVQAAVRDARERMATDPEGAYASLVQEAARLRVAPELDPADRARLLEQLGAVAREAARRSSAAHTAAVHARDVQAEQQSRRDLHQSLVTREREIDKQLTHANDLAARGQYRAAEEAARALTNGNSTIVGTAAPLEAQMKVNAVEMQALAERRRQHLQEEFLNQDRQQAVDSDGRPIVYPSVDRWRQLTERRREWRENASTYRSTDGERRINRALQTVTSVDFQEMPLADVIDYLKNKFHIEIQLDSKGLTDENIGPSVPITKNLHNIKLRSILRLILGDLNLAYVVKDDVLLITSVEAADTMVTTRVYDVGDLVTPIPVPGFF